MKFYHFIPTDNAEDEGVPNPKLAKQFIPDWYKKAEITFKDKQGDDAPGLKTCIPFLDAMISGYMLTTWADVYVKQLSDGTVDIDWDDKASSPLIHERPKESGLTIPRPAGHLPNHLAWSPKWGVKSPRGWSTLVIHPLNRYDLPFTTMSGIMDSDKYCGSGNIPFFLKEGFEGIIPKGTPIAQLIPIKRASWSAGVYDPSLKAYVHNLGHIVRGVKRGGYRDKFWVKKEYNLEEN